MKQFKEVYNLQNDAGAIKLAQQLSLDKDNEYGLKIENNLLFGTPEWFEAIDKGLIKKNIISGIISNTIISGHNDYPIFEIENENGKTVWSQKGDTSVYKVGCPIELTFVEQKSRIIRGAKRTISKCVIQIKISNEK